MLTTPNATDRITIAASPLQVYGLIANLDAMTDLAEECSGYRVLDGPTHPAQVGTRFQGKNRNGWRRWSTTCAVTDADPGRRFAFDVSVGRFPASRWQYDIEAVDGRDDSGEVTVIESTWDRRARWARIVGGLGAGVMDRDRANRDHIAATLRRLKQRAEAESKGHPRT